MEIPTVHNGGSAIYIILWYMFRLYLKKKCPYIFNQNLNECQNIMYKNVFDKVIFIVGHNNKCFFINQLLKLFKKDCTI